MNCTELDVALVTSHRLVVESDGGFAAGCLLLFLASLALLTHGERLVRPLSALVGAVGAAIGVFVATALFDPPPDCMLRLGASGVAAVLAAVLALCIFKTGLFVLGATGVAAVTHFVYEALPLDGVPPPFVLLGRSGYYYAAMLVAAVVGAAVAYAQHTHFVRISSSLVGAGGLALLCHLVVGRVNGEAVPGVALLGILVVATLAGVATQRYLAKRRETARRRRTRRPRQENDTEVL